MTTPKQRNKILRTIWFILGFKKQFFITICLSDEIIINSFKNIDVPSSELKTLNKMIVTFFNNKTLLNNNENNNKLLLK